MGTSAAAVCRSCGHALDRQGACLACGATFLADEAVAIEPDTTQTNRRTSDSLVGRTILNQYVVRERIGDGGMGAVYRAEQVTVGRDAAIKVLHPQVSGNAELAERFRQEARAASQLNHPHIVTIYNYGAMEDGTLFLAMEYLDGVSLQQLISRSGPIAPERAVKIATQIADSLADAHDHGIVHRDLKPHNVMLVERSQRPDFVKVLDFGIAKIQGVDMTAAGILCGTPRYMSPEQLRGEKIDGRSDLYSLGIVLFEMLAGSTPFQSESVLGFVDKHLNATPPALSEVARRKKFPPALEDFVKRLLAKNPQDRPKSATALARELATVLDAPPPSAPVESKREKRAIVVAPAGPSQGVVLARRAWSWIGVVAAAIVAQVRRAWSAGAAMIKARAKRKRKTTRMKNAWKRTRGWASSLARKRKR